MSFVTQETISTQDTRSILAQIAKGLPKLKNSESLELCKLVADLLKPRISNFMEVDGMFKRAAANIYDVQNATYEAILQL